MAEQEELKKYGKCRIEREIGRGALATVYLAWHETLRIPVALKVIAKEKGQQEDDFSRRQSLERRDLPRKAR